VNRLQKLFNRLRANAQRLAITGGWGEKGPETGNCQSSEKA
jgi:hypothetical protein